MPQNGPSFFRTVLLFSTIFFSSLFYGHSYNTNISTLG